MKNNKKNSKALQPTRSSMAAMSCESGKEPGWQHSRRKEKRNMPVLTMYLSTSFFSRTTSSSPAASTPRPHLCWWRSEITNKHHAYFSSMPEQTFSIYLISGRCSFSCWWRTEMIRTHWWKTEIATSLTIGAVSAHHLFANGLDAILDAFPCRQEAERGMTGSAERHATSRSVHLKVTLALTAIQSSFPLVLLLIWLCLSTPPCKSSDHARHFAKWCDICKAVKVVHGSWSDNDCNWSGRQLSIRLLELY